MMFEFSSDNEQPQENSRVMVATPDTFLKNRLVHILEPAGFLTLQADDELQAVELATGHLPGISILDAMMPPDDLGRSYKQSFPSTIVILMLANYHGSMLTHMEYILTKPFTEIEFRELISLSVLFPKTITHLHQSHFRYQIAHLIISALSEARTQADNGIDEYVRQQLNSEHDHIRSSAQFILNHLMR